MSLSYTDLKKGVLFVLNNEPYEVLESGFLRMQQRKAVMQTKIQNLITGKILDRNWQASDYFEEAEVERKSAIFIYSRSLPAGPLRRSFSEASPLRRSFSEASRQEHWFHEEGNPQSRFSMTSEALGKSAQFLKPNTKIETLIFNNKVIKISLPIKMDFEVIEAPPAIRGNTAQGGTKQATIEGGAKINVPLFVNTGDIVRINTETGEYVERAEKK